MPPRLLLVLALGVLGGCTPTQDDRFRFEKDGWRLASAGRAELAVRNLRGHEWAITCAQRPADIWVYAPDAGPSQLQRAALTVGSAVLSLSAGPGNDVTRTIAVGDSDETFLASVARGGPVSLVLDDRLIELPRLRGDVGAHFARQCATEKALYSAAGGDCQAARELSAQLFASGQHDRARAMARASCDANPAGKKAP